MDGRDDDLEMEVSDLHTGQVADSPPAAHRVGAGAHGRVARLLASRRTRGCAVAGLVLLVCAGLVLSLPGMQQALQQALASPTPSPTVPFTPSANLVYFMQTAPWGRLTLDGTLLEPPQPGKTSSLQPGRHTLTYAAAPWAPLRCQLSVPAQQGDTCPVNGSAQFGNEPLARVIDLGATPERLPEAQRTALTSAVASAFQAHVETTSVLPGDHYLGADGEPAVATIPLQASVTLTLNTDAARAAPLASQCVTLCEMEFGGDPDWWEVMAHVIVRWQFAASDGTTIYPGTSPDLDVGYVVGAAWSGSGSGTWSVALQPSPSSRGQLCWPAFQRAVPTGTLPTGAYPGPNDADGCVLVASPGSGSVSVSSGPNAASSPLPANAAIFIARFGIVLAGNDAAHAAAPQLPVASAHERALAQQWMAQG